MGSKVKKKVTEKIKEKINSDETDLIYECTGNFYADFVELAKRSKFSFIPSTVPQERVFQPSPNLDLKQSKNKSSVKTIQTESDSFPSERVTKTYKVIETSEFMAPKITIVQDNVDKQDISECIIKDWRIFRYLEILTTCWLAVEKLTAIKLWNVGLNSDASIQILKCLKKMKNLKTFHLEGNCEKLLTYHLFINDEIAVKFLSFRFNKINDNIALMISKSIQNIKTCDLVSINLSNNEISDEGAVHLANGLKQNRSLLSLDLSKNYIGDRGSLALGESLSKYELNQSEIAERRKQMMRKSIQDSSDHTTAETASLKIQEKSTKVAIKSSNKKKREDETKSGKGSKKENEKHGKKEKPVSKSREKIQREKSPAETFKRTSKQTISAETKESLQEKTNFDDSKVFAAGNTILLNLNLAYNKITENSLKMWLNVLQIQQSQRNQENKYNQGDGLISLVLEKNLFDDDDEDFEKIKNLLQIKNPISNQTLECMSLGSVHSKK